MRAAHSYSQIFDFYDLVYASGISNLLNIFRWLGYAGLLLLQTAAVTCTMTGGSEDGGASSPPGVKWDAGSCADDK